ncbi:MAG: 1-phosphofructokinase family hexose kinase [Candidatus Hydrogenedentes bacterium]|nr:1-phosphofructokinase family hexose kinase [Candidatus Hydrogenedentota bacterium]
MILTVTPNPCVDKTVYVDEIKIGTFMRSSRCTCIAGGKGTNVSRGIAALGRTTRAMVIVGGHSGAHVVEMIEKQDCIECIPAWVASQTRTITTVLEQTVHRQTAFFEPGSRVTNEEAQGIVETFRNALPGAKVVTFSGTVPDPSIKWLYRELIPIAKKAQVVALLDSHGPEFALGLEAVPYMVKPNISEAEELLGYSLETMDARWRAVEEFHQRGVELVVLSLGREGALVSRGSERFQVIPPHVREVNPVGSGDALLSAFAIGLIEGMPLKMMAMLGCAAGTANAMSWDIGHFSREEVEALLPRMEIRSISE